MDPIERVNFDGVVGRSVDGGFCHSNNMVRLPAHVQAEPLGTRRISHAIIRLATATSNSRTRIIGADYWRKLADQTRITVGWLQGATVRVGHRPRLRPFGGTGDSAPNASSPD